MPDQKPSRSVSDELTTLHSLLQFQRKSMVRKVSGVDEDAARRAVVPSGTTLLWLVKHLAGAEIIWVLRRFAGEDEPIPDPSPCPGDTVEAAVALYRETWARVDAVVFAAASLDDLCRSPGPEGPVNLRWVLGHLLEETARHAGHADILRELIDGETGR